MQDITIRQTLLSERGLTLEKCLEIARSFEGMKICMKAIQDKTDPTEQQWIQSTNFQRQLNRVLNNYPGVVSLVDDTMVYGKDLQKHDHD